MNYSRGNAGDGGEAAPGGLVPVSQQALLGRDPYSIAVPYGGDATADATPVFGLSLHEYLRILIKRKWLILSILGVAVVIGALTTLMKTRLYPSPVRMQLDPNTAKCVRSGRRPAGGRRPLRPHENPIRASQRPDHGRACRFGVEARRGSGFLPAAQFLDHRCDLQDHRARRRFPR